MSRLRSIASPVAAFALVASLSGSARAACCDNAWSCLGAILTAGASCAVEEAVAKINEFVQRVERTRRDGETNMRGSIRQLDDEASRDHVSLNQETQEAFVSVQQARARAQTASGRQRDKSNTETEQLLEQALARIAALEAEAAQSKNASQSRLQQANAERQRLVDGMNATFQAAFLAPIAGLLAPLVAAVEPVSAAATIAVAATTLRGIQQTTERLMSQRFSEFEARARADHDALTQQKAEQQRRSTEAAALATSIEALTSTAAASPDSKAKLKGLLKPGQFAKLGKLVPLKLAMQPRAQALPALKKNVLADAQFASTVKVSKNFDKAKANTTVQAEFDRRLADKKTEKELRAEEKKLLDEAKARFSKDPKTLKAAEDFIHAEIDKRAKALAEPKPAPKAPIAAPAPKAPIAAPAPKAPIAAPAPKAPIAAPAPKAPAAPIQGKR